MEYIYEELAALCLDHGYTITFRDDAGMEARHKNGVTFSQMKDGGYVESTLYRASDDICVCYDILAGEYTTDLFTDKIGNQETAAAWVRKISDEVERLQLTTYIH